MRGEGAKMAEAGLNLAAALFLRAIAGSASRRSHCRATFWAHRC
jgi:hypothetical protein